MPSSPFVVALLLSALGAWTMVACGSAADSSGDAPDAASDQTALKADGRAQEAGFRGDGDAGGSRDVEGGSDDDAFVAPGPCQLGSLPEGGTVVDLTTVSLTSFADAIRTASAHPDDYVIRIAPGTFDLSHQALGNAAFDVSNITPATGRFIITGAGSSRTTIILADYEPPTYGVHAAHICFVGMHFAKARYTASQAIVVSVAKDDLVVDVQPGFPSPGALHTDNGQGYFLRQYTASTSNPLLLDQYPSDPNDNQQVPWGNPTELDGGAWRLTAHSMGQWDAGDLLGIKAEPGTTADAGEGPGHGAGTFKSSNDIVFNDIEWTGASRMEFFETNGVQVLNSSIQRPPALDGQTPCMSVSGGGPQISGGTLDGGTSGHVIANFTADSTGDDSIAFYNGAKGVVVHSQLSNSFSKRCINSDPTTSVTVDSYTQAHAVNCRLVLPDGGT